MQIVKKKLKNEAQKQGVHAKLVLNVLCVLISTTVRNEHIKTIKGMSAVH